MSELASVLEIPGVWRGHVSSRIQAMPTGHAGLDALLPGGGVPCGALTELLYAQYGVGELSLILPMMARLTQAGGRVVMMAPPCIPYAPALSQAGIALPRLVIMQPPSQDEVPWGLEQSLHAGVFGLVVAWCQRITSEALLRLQRAAENGGSIGILMRPLSAATQASHAALRLCLHSRPEGLDIEILKARGGRTGQHWLLAA
jgi:protein ImuA